MRKVNFPTVYSTGSTCDESNAKDQTLVKVAATGNFTAADRVILGRGTIREEEGIIAAGGVDPGVKITLEANLAYNHTVDAETTVDLESAPAGDNKILKVALTADFLPGETVLVDVGEADEKSYVIDSVQLNDSLTMTEVLKRTHDATEVVAQTGIGGVVEVCMASLSSVLYKGSHQVMAIFLPAEWTTAGITFVGCNIEDGTYYQVVKATDVAEVVVASVVAGKVIGLDGIVKQALEGIPYLKLRSGTLAAPVDQGKSGVVIEIILGK